MHALLHHQRSGFSAASTRCRARACCPPPPRSSALPAKAAGTLVTLELNVARAPAALRIEILPENAEIRGIFLALPGHAGRGALL